jgi:hypothetical protein
MEEPLLKADGFDKAIIGTAHVWQNNTRVETMIYQAEKILDILVDENGMTPEEALEYFDFNMDGAYVGVTTPIYVWEYDEQQSD